MRSEPLTGLAFQRQRHLRGIWPSSVLLQMARFCAASEASFLPSFLFAISVPLLFSITNAAVVSAPSPPLPMSKKQTIQERERERGDSKSKERNEKSSRVEGKKCWGALVIYSTFPGYVIYTLISTQATLSNNSTKAHLTSPPKWEA